MGPFVKQVLTHAASQRDSRTLGRRRKRDTRQVLDLALGGVGRVHGGVGCHVLGDWFVKIIWWRYCFNGCEQIRLCSLGA